MLTRILRTNFWNEYRLMSSSFQAMQNKVEVSVLQGRVVGLQDTLPNGKPLFSFKGIPYAQSPIGELRFTAPKALEKFKEPVLDCSRERDPCYHKDMISLETVGSEDCLFLNVYTPKLSDAKDLPVMIWIHGGAFASGSGDSDYFSPEYLVEQNVIVVTINYRLSILGFLCLPDAGIYGNAGLKDQRLAMQWVQQNIGKFGGNANNITLFGESAGAACVHIHTLSANSRKYFHKAICQSGNAIMEWVMQSKAEEKSKILASRLGCTETDPQKILQFLRGIDHLPTLFKEYFGTLSDDERRRGLPIVFKPTVERETDEAIITKPPLELMQTQIDAACIPVMMGYNSKDGLIMLIDALKNNKFEQYEKDLAVFIPKSVNLPVQDERCKILANKIRDFYLSGEKLCESTLDGFVDLLTDYHFTILSYLAAELHSRYQNSPMYFFRFSIDKDFNLYKKFTLMALGMPKTDIFKGACHADEIYYLFSCRKFSKKPSDFPESEVLLRRTCALWTNFAKYGDPTPSTSNFPLWNPVKKIAANEKDFKLDYFEIDNDRLVSCVNPDGKRIEFWREIYYKFNNGLMKAKL
ncbi:esterase B1-like [Sitodiplosis mosellana]|uniref:esterase B1-like n=1 Tax=Sitodiplosis mosellana TaxID=263140 RepID=UPI002443FD65|nr:esterase B1-like [Sitodiplosis mosellana]